MSENESESVVVREASLFWQWLCRMAIKLKKASIRAVAWVLRMVLAADSRCHEQVVGGIKNLLHKLERSNGENDSTVLEQSSD